MNTIKHDPEPFFMALGLSVTLAVLFAIDLILMVI